VRLRPGQTVEYIITDAEARIPNDRVRAYAQWDSWHGYDRKKYAAMLREAFEPFERVQCGGIASAAQRNLLLFGSVFPNQGRCEAAGTNLLPVNQSKSRVRE